MLNNSNTLNLLMGNSNGKLNELFPQTSKLGSNEINYRHMLIPDILGKDYYKGWS